MLLDNYNLRRIETPMNTAYNKKNDRKNQEGAKKKTIKHWFMKIQVYSDAQIIIIKHTTKPNANK